MHGRVFRGLALVAALLGFAANAGAEPLGSHQPHIEASLGARVSKVGSSGYDPYATSDELVQVSLGLGATLLRADRFSLAGVAFWDYGGRSATARGEATSLSSHRLTIGPELRYHIIPQLYVFAQALPAFAYTETSLDDTVAAATLSARHWSYGVDASGGAAFEFFGRRSGESRLPRVWAIAQGGYGYLGSTHDQLKPDSNSGAPERTASVDLPSLSLAGPYLRISVAVSY